MRKSVTRKNCEAAYSDLLLATLDFGIAKGRVEALRSPGRFKVKLARLEEDLLSTSHNLRPKCRR